MSNFWEKLPKPIFVLAPLANVTDSAFRRVIAKYGKPDVIWTEFVSADGLVKGNREVLMRDLVFTESERPIIAQFFSATPQYMESAARLALELGFDGIDINMGCPDKSIEKQKAGAMLMKNPKLAAQLIAAAKRGAGHLPVSVKTRIGYNKVEIEEWLPALLDAGPVAITVHGRTRKEMSKVDAHWDCIKRAVEIRNEKKSSTLILGNGDVKTIEEAQNELRKRELMV
jgi:tRNA-dihydrouridine synthase